jgi:hypothetical protein
MLDNPNVLPAHLALSLWLKPSAPDNVLVSAAQLLAEGYGAGPSLPRDAGLAAPGDRGAYAAHPGRPR